MRHFLNKTVLFLTLVIPLYFLASAFSEEPKTYTNDDLNKYPSQPSQSYRPPVTQEENKSEQRIKSTNTAYNQEYYCSWGSFYQNQIDRQKERIEEAKKELLYAEEGYTSKSKDAWKQKNNIYNANQKLKHAEYELKEAERNYSNLANEAHRKRFPPGWLRCQF